MHFIELLLGLSVFTFIFSFVPLLYIENNKFKDLILTISAVSIILIAICLFFIYLQCSYDLCNHMVW